MNAAELRAAVGYGVVERVNFVGDQVNGWSACVDTSPDMRTVGWVVTARGGLRVWRTLDAAVAFFARIGLQSRPVLVAGVDLSTAGRGEL